MPITFNCPCGKMLRVPDENAGRRAKCPACNAVVAVPKPEPEPSSRSSKSNPSRLVVRNRRANRLWTTIPTTAPTYSLAPESRDDDDDSGGSSKKSSSRGKSGLPNFRKGKDNYT